jgi:O-antigen/teichoic acid export membrane protein
MQKLMRLVQLAFSKEPSASDGESRSALRYQRAARAALMAMVARAANIITNLISVPLTVKYLGADLFGLWMTVTDFVSFMGFADFGLSIGMQNALTRCDGDDDREMPRVIVSSTIAFLVAIMVVVQLFSLFVLPALPLGRLVGASSEAVSLQVLPTLQIMLAVFSFGLLANLVCRIYDAYQQGFWGNAWLALGRILALCGVIGCVLLEAPLPLLALCYSGIPFFVLFVAAIGLFRKMPWLIPSVRCIRFSELKRIMQVGVAALGAQLAYLMIEVGPTLLIANRFGVAAVGVFSVARKLTGVTSLLLGTAAAPLWPAFGEASARGDWDWVRSTFRRAIQLMALIYLPAFLVIAFAGQWLIGLWTRGEIIPSWSLLMAVNIWSVLMAWNTIVCVLLNGLSHMIGQATYGIAFALISLGLAYAVSGPDSGSLELCIWTLLLAGVLTRSVALGMEARQVIHRRRGATVG